MKRQWKESERFATQWYGLDGEVEIEFDLSGHILTISDLRPDFDESGISYNPIIMADFRLQVRSL